MLRKDGYAWMNSQLTRRREGCGHVCLHRETCSSPQSHHDSSYIMYLTYLFKVADRCVLEDMVVV